MLPGTAAGPGRGRGLSAAPAVAGLTPFSSLDYPGQLAAVVFLQGCPWRCVYCHNPGLQARGPGRLDWAGLLAWLERRRGLLDALVFSGGEPTLDAALPRAAAQVRARGFKVGLHTAGLYPERLATLLPLLDWVGLDIKAPLTDAALHRRITGVPGAEGEVAQSLALLAASGLGYECRSTIHPALHDGAALQQLAEQLAGAGVTRWALQIARPDGTAGGAGALAPVPPDYPDAALLARLRGRVPGLELRRG